MINFEKLNKINDIYLDASLKHEAAVDYSSDIPAPSMDSSWFVVAVSALDVHLDNVAVAYIDWDHFALHDVDEAVHDSSYRFDTLKKQNNKLVYAKNTFFIQIFVVKTHRLEVYHRMDSMQQSYRQMC